MNKKELDRALTMLGLPVRSWNRVLREATGRSRFTAWRWITGITPIPPYLEKILSVRVDIKRREREWFR
jgi:hypothetical protein